MLTFAVHCGRELPPSYPLHIILLFLPHYHIYSCPCLLHSRCGLRGYCGLPFVTSVILHFTTHVALHLRFPTAFAWYYGPLLLIAHVSTAGYPPRFALIVDYLNVLFLVRCPDSPLICGCGTLPFIPTTVTRRWNLPFPRCLLVVALAFRVYRPRCCIADTTFGTLRLHTPPVIRAVPYPV